MWKRLFSWFFVLGVGFYSSNPVFAKTIEEELAELKSRITGLEQKLAAQEEKSGEQKEERDRLIKINQAFDGLSIGAGATVIDKINIGDRVTVGAGAVVTKGVQNNITVVGVPAKITKVG